MSYLPARRKKERMNVRVVEKKESAKHRRFVRAHVCAVNLGKAGVACAQPSQCAHIRDGLPMGQQAGMGQKPHDMWTVPLCHHHHAEYDNGINGSWKVFEAKYGLDLQKIARALALESKDDDVRGYAQRQPT
jgi:hypothetical protein